MTDPYTRGGITISGFIEGDSICFDDLNTTIGVPGKIYSVANAEFTIGGQIGTEFEITNRIIRYKQSNGDCWEVILEDVPANGAFSQLNRVS